VVGFDDVPLARHLSPTLTTVRQPSRQLGAVAVETLVALLEGANVAKRDIVLPTELIVRGSCGCHAGTTPVNQAAAAVSGLVSRP
jgi:LacI family transcriptional regulator